MAKPRLKTHYKATDRDARRAARDLQVGDVFWVITDIAVNLAPWEDEQLLERMEVTRRHWLFDTPMSSVVDVKHLVRTRGIYTERPKGYRALHEATPQVAGPLDGLQKFDRALTKGELLWLESVVGRKEAKKVAKRVGLVGAR